MPKDSQVVTRLHPVSARFLSRSIRAPLPVVQEPHVDSLVVVVNLTPLLVGAGGLAIVERVLYLVERYFNSPLRLKVQAETLREEIDRITDEEGAGGRGKLRASCRFSTTRSVRHRVRVPRSATRAARCRR